MAGLPPKSPPSAAEERLLSPATAGAVSGLFAQLVAFHSAQHRIIEFPMGAQLTLQDLARDLLEPMMRDWLDKNALPIVEKVVQVEFARAISRGAET